MNTWQQHGNHTRPRVARIPHPPSPKARAANERTGRVMLRQTCAHYLRYGVAHTRPQASTSKWGGGSGRPIRARWRRGIPLPAPRRLRAFYACSLSQAGHAVNRHSIRCKMLQEIRGMRGNRFLRPTGGVNRLTQGAGWGLGLQHLRPSPWVWVCSGFACAIPFVSDQTETTRTD